MVWKSKWGGRDNERKKWFRDYGFKLKKWIKCENRKDRKILGYERNWNKMGGDKNGRRR